MSDHDALIRLETRFDGLCTDITEMRQEHRVMAGEVSDIHDILIRHNLTNPVSKPPTLPGVYTLALSRRLLVTIALALLAMLSGIVGLSVDWAQLRTAAEVACKVAP